MKGHDALSVSSHNFAVFNPFVGITNELKYFLYFMKCFALTGGHTVGRTVGRTAGHKVAIPLLGANCSMYPFQEGKRSSVFGANLPCTVDLVSQNCSSSTRTVITKAQLSPTVILLSPLNLHSCA